MRLSFNSFPDRLISTLGGLANRQMRYQVQAATGQRISAPEDDPAAMRRVLDLQGEGTRVGQYQRNVGRLQEIASATHGVIRGLARISDRAGEIATRADGGRSKQELDIMAKEVTQMIQQAVSTGNTTNRGDSLLGGTQTGRPAYAIQMGTEGQVVGVLFQGNADAPSIEIAEGSTVVAHSVGANSSGSGAPGLLADSRSGVDFFKHLIDLQNRLRAGDINCIAATTRPALQADGDNLLSHVSQNAALQSRLEVAGAAAEQRLGGLDQQISNESDADLAQTLVRLNETQLSYQAALQSSGKILSMSLLDYLR